MASYHSIDPGKNFMGKLEHGKDLLAELTGICIDNSISLGRVEAIGAVKKARIGYYDQDSLKYEFIEFNKHLEIVTLIGNISIRNDKPIIHAHICLSDSEGKCFGGHLAEGTEIFACEFTIQQYNGPEFTRGLDNITKLPLWDM